MNTSITRGARWMGTASLSPVDGSTEPPPHDPDEVHLVARGIASAVAPAAGLTGVEVDYHNLEPLGAADLAEVLAARDEGYRRRIVHHMVLGELVLRPLPTEVALRVAAYAKAL